MAFVTPEQGQRAQALRVWTNTQLDTLRASALRVLQDWRAAWSMEASTGQVLILEREPQRRPSTDTLQRALQHALFGASTHTLPPSAESPISRQVSAQAWDDWRSRTLAWAGVDLVGEAERGQPLLKPKAWSGDVLLQLPWFGLDWTYHVPSDSVARIVPAQLRSVPSLPPRVSLGQALDDHVLAAQANLAPVTLRLGDLTTLAIGDIVTLTHALDQPLSLTTQEGQALLCSGWLGQRNGHKAMELVPAVPTASLLASFPCKHL